MIRQLCIPSIGGHLVGEMIIDLFAGGGGASHGIEMALGRCVDAAINHDQHAIAMHRLNHPSTTHYCESVYEVDPLAVTRGQRVGLLWASPDCTHFSRAKGGKPRSQKIRGLAWVVCTWAAAVAPRMICMENVEEFLTWGPLDEAGQPIKEREGETFAEFVAQLRTLGYVVEWRSIRAQLFKGTRTTRKRLYLIARRDGQPIVWPAPECGADPLPAFGTAAECIDWTDLGSSIFDRKRPLADATCRRIAHGLMRYVVDAASPFIVRLGQWGGNGKYSNGADSPLTTITSKNEHAVVSPIVTRAHSHGWDKGGGPSRRADAPMWTVTAKDGQALVSAFLAKHYTGVVGQDLRASLGTVTAIDHHSLVGATLIQTGFGERKGQAPRVPGLDKPLGTVMGGGCKHALVGAFLTKYYGDGREQVQGVDESLHTITTRARFGLVTVMIDGAEYVISDILLRMLRPRELARAQGFPDDYQLIGTQAQQVARIGNSVCPPVARALVAANLTIPAMPRRRARKAVAA